MTWEINKDKCKKLLYYIGCGNFTNPHIVFLGNEEGLGDQSIEANIEARYEYCGKNEQNQYINCIDEENCDYKKGYWEQSGKTLDEKVLRYLKENNQEINTDTNAKNGNFLRSLARICLAIENPSLDKSYWFRKVDLDKQAKLQIDDYVKNNLFGSNGNQGLQSVLMDWRHLPRRNQNIRYDKHEEYRNLIKHTEFTSAFNFEDRKRKTKSFSKYKEYAEIRLSVYKEVFEKCNIPVLITLGETGQKETLLKKIYPNITFEPVYINSLRRNCGKYGNVQTSRGKMNVFIIPHPNSHEFGTGELLAFLQELTYEHLVPRIQL